MCIYTSIYVSLAFVYIYLNMYEYIAKCLRFLNSGVIEKVKLGRKKKTFKMKSKIREN